MTGTPEATVSPARPPDSGPYGVLSCRVPSGAKSTDAANVPSLGRAGRDTATGGARNRECLVHSVGVPRIVVPLPVRPGRLSTG